MTQRVVFSLAGQELRHTVPGPVVSATFEIVDLSQSLDSSDRTIDSGAATVPAFTMTLTLAAGPSEPDPYAVTVDATAGASVGDTLMITGDGASESLDVLGINAADLEIEFTSSLARDYAIGSTVTGATITADVPAGLYNFELALDDQRPLGVVWSYTALGVPVVVLEQISLLRTTSSTLISDALRFVRTGYHDVSARMKPGIDVFAPMCASMVESDLRLRGERPELLLLGDPGAWLLHDRIIAELAQRGYAPNTVDLDRFVTLTADRYAVSLEALVIGTRGTDTLDVDTETMASENPSTRRVSPVQIAF